MHFPNKRHLFFILAGLLAFGFLRQVSYLSKNVRNRSNQNRQKWVPAQDVALLDDDVDDDAASNTVEKRKGQEDQQLHKSQTSKDTEIHEEDRDQVKNDDWMNTNEEEEDFEDKDLNDEDLEDEDFEDEDGDEFKEDEYKELETAEGADHYDNDEDAVDSNEEDEDQALDDYDDPEDDTTEDFEDVVNGDDEEDIEDGFEEDGEETESEEKKTVDKHLNKPLRDIVEPHQESEEGEKQLALENIQEQHQFGEVKEKVNDHIGGNTEDTSEKKLDKGMSLS